MAYEKDPTPDETMPGDDAMPSDADVEDTPLENEEPATSALDESDPGI